MWPLHYAPNFLTLGICSKNSQNKNKHYMGQRTASSQKARSGPCAASASSTSERVLQACLGVHHLVAATRDLARQQPLQGMHLGLLPAGAQFHRRLQRQPLGPDTDGPGLSRFHASMFSCNYHDVIVSSSFDPHTLSVHSCDFLM
jgi:hypothetical protein